MCDCRPERAKALPKHHSFAFSRRSYPCPTTQGVALGYELVALSGRFNRTGRNFLLKNDADTSKAVERQETSERPFWSNVRNNMARVYACEDTLMYFVYGANLFEYGTIPDVISWELVAAVACSGGGENGFGMRGDGHVATL